MPQRGKNIKNANLSPRKIPQFRKFAEMYTRENIFVHSISTEINSVFLKNIFYLLKSVFL